MNAFDVDQKLDRRSRVPQRTQHAASPRHPELQLRVRPRRSTSRSSSSSCRSSPRRKKSIARKGFLAIAGNPRRAIFHGVNNRFTIMWDRLWEKDETRTSQLVFIGKGLDEAAIRAELEKCLA